MREISFQGRSFDGTWYEGNLVKHGNQAHIVYYDHLGIEHWHEVDEVTVCQFTGLHDKYGTKIYEGDIVEFNDFASLRTGGHIDDNIVIGKVKFLYGGWMVDSKEGHYDLYEAVINDEEIEIIGNIYEEGE